MLSFDINRSWYDGLYQDKGSVVAAARSFKLVHEEKSEKAVLLLHGYAGYPGELVRPANDLYAAGFDVYVPRLPGMGTTGKDFVNSSSHDWLTVCSNALKELLLSYDSVDIVAHSMGTLIAIILASSFSVNHLVLASPAFKMPALKPTLIKFLSLFKKDISIAWQSDPRYHLHYEGAPADDAVLGKEYWSHIYPSALKELIKLQKSALKLFPHLTCDTLLIAATNDQITDPFMVEKIALEKKKGITKCIYIKDATHYLFYDISPKVEDEAVKAVLEFLS